MKFLIFTTAVALFVAGFQTAATKSAESAPTTITNEIKDVSVAEAQVRVSKAHAQFIDVRTTEEYSRGHAARATNMPLDTIKENMGRLNKDEPVYVICQTGSRSKKAASLLSEAGFKNVINILGGTSAWEAEKLPMETQSPHNPKN